MGSMGSRALRVALALGATGALVVTGAAVVDPTRGGGAVCAYFDDSYGLFPDSPVTIRGIPVGKVDSIEPEGPRVRVVMRIDDRALPADTGAVITHTSVLTDRRVELVDADPSPGPTLEEGTCIDTTRTRTPVTVSQALGSFSELVRQMTEEGPDGHAPLETTLRRAGSEFDSLGPTLNRELRDLADLLSGSDEVMADLGLLLDNSAELSTMAATNWDDVKTTAQTFAPGLAGIEEMLKVAKILVEKLSMAVGPMDRLFNDHMGEALDALESTIPTLTMVRARVEESEELFQAIPGVIHLAETMVGARPGSVSVDYAPPHVRLSVPDAPAVCGALQAAGLGDCAVESPNTVTAPLPQLLFSTLGEAP